jgi:murein DD-endopeptidase MepM/ murein hydrolase activator NlpD
MPKRPWQGVAQVHIWPTEPESPSTIDPERFSVTLAKLCRRLPSKRAQSYAGWILRYSQQFDVDPFTIAATLFNRSRCRSTTKKAAKSRRARRGKSGKSGDCIGLARIHLPSHAGLIKEGRYRYWTLGEGRWNPRELEVGDFPFTRSSLKRPEANIYFTAALLAVYKRQCPSLDGAIRSEPHRHPVSHLIWGDRVHGAWHEDLVLRARRRMLRLYQQEPPRPLAELRGIPLHSPLDGVPRVVSSSFYDWREGTRRRRRHRAIDYYSTYGEPVRAVADGVVIFAGIDHPKTGASNLSPARARRVRSSATGIGGLFVIIRHGRGLSTGYFHLAGYTVRQGMKVKGGELIGFVGRSGIKQSAAHLHLDMRLNKRKVNPAHHLAPYLLGRGLKLRPVS